MVLTMASNENSVRINSSENTSMEGSNSNINLEADNLQDKLELLLLQQQLHQNRNLFLEREMGLNINRSGSAPPTVEGALRAASNLFIMPNLAQSYNTSTSCNNNSTPVNNRMTEEEIRSTPEYLEYYYSHENLNPRLPPPLLSKEDWRVAQRVKAAPGFGLGDWRNTNKINNSGCADDGVNSSSLFSMQPGEDAMLEFRKAALRNISHKNSSELLDKLCNDGSGMGLRRKSFADILQEGSGRPTSHMSRPTSQNSMDEFSSDQNVVEMQNKGEVSKNTLREKAVTGLSNPQNLGSTSSSFSNNTANEMVRKPLSSGRINGSHLAEKLNSTAHGPSNVSSSSIFEFANAAESLSGINTSRVGQLSNEDILRSSLLMRMSTGLNPNQQHYIENLINRGLMRGLNNSNPIINEMASLPRRAASTTNLQAQLSPSGLASLEAMRNLLGSPMAGTLGDGHNLRNSNHAGIYFPFTDHLDQLRGRNMTKISGNTSQGGHINNDPRSCSDLQALENAYLEALLLQQKQQYLSQYLLEVGNSAFSPYPASSMMNALHSGASARSPVFQNERSGQSTRNSRNVKGESSGMLRSQSGGNLKSGKFEALIEGVKNSRNKALDLSDVLGHVIEFSTDQFGSRFIQQKLENATDEEKTKILAEIIPHARELMIDVFGNYVIQKFFGHGSDKQRKELATHLMGHVLTLSLHMYGCRVIQKALEVVDVELKTKIVTELDGSVIKCVRDQNGNHVIQKCIECVPQDRIQFIIKPFLGQVANLSTHPYGCRVIQRVIEHCDDPKTQQIMDEIVAAVCNLAEDQYGNYVLQHVLQHGKPHERSAIISKLAGGIVKMSQQKFASNVIEKCLTYGKPEERKLLVNEMLGSTDDNEPLQAMMKDQFGNYVVQKVIETCDEQSRELILSRVKDHLSILKKYTYGKHIVSRVEKLLATGEKHTAKSPSRNA